MPHRVVTASAVQFRLWYSVGPDNGHPHSEGIQKLLKKVVTLFRVCTSLQLSIVHKRRLAIIVRNALTDSKKIDGLITYLLTYLLTYSAL